MVYRIISFDGGGVRGLFTAKALSQLVGEVQLLKRVDLFAGTSTGALIALGLGLGYHPEQLVGLYQKFAPVIFSGQSSSKAGHQALYQNQHLKELLLTHVFVKNPSLADLSSDVVVPVFQLCDPKTGYWKPTCFHNFDKKEAKKHAVVDVALAACAAPMFFPAYQGYVDGGVFANNPSMFAVAQALRHRKLALAEIKLFSLGTTWQPIALPKEGNWGAAQWHEYSKEVGYPLFSLLTEGAVDVPHEECEQILGSRYHRLNLTAPQFLRIDGVEHMPMLLELAEKLPQERSWDQTVQWLKESF